MKYIFSARLREHLSRMKNKPQLKAAEKIRLKAAEKKYFSLLLSSSPSHPFIRHSRVRLELIETKNVQHTLHLFVFFPLSLSLLFIFIVVDVVWLFCQTISLWIQVMILYLHRTIYSLIFLFLLISLTLSSSSVIIFKVGSFSTLQRETRSERGGGCGGAREWDSKSSD